MNSDPERAKGEGILDRIQLVEILVDLLFTLEERVDCPSCDGSGIVWHDTLTAGGGIETTPEVCHCEIVARSVLARSVGPRREAILSEYLRNHGHDPEEIGKRTAALVAELLEKFKPKGEDDDESDPET